MELESGKLVTRAQISTALKDGFRINQGERMVRYALDALEIGPDERRARQGQPGGPVSYYDPIALWTIASVFHRSRHSLKPGKDRLRPYRRISRTLATMPEAAFIPRFVEDETFAAQLLLVGCPDLGMDPVRRREYIADHPWLLGWCGNGSGFMTEALLSWEVAYTDVLSRLKAGECEQSGDGWRSVSARAFVKDLGDRLSRLDPALTDANANPDLPDEGGDAGQQ